MSIAGAAVAVVGAGPAGLMAAERLASLGHRVTVYEQMASPARKFLMAGRGGLNLTHSEDAGLFLARYGPAASHLAPALAAWPPEAMTAWADGLGAEIFTGSSGRVFPRAMKASPLLRAWLGRLDGLGVQLRLRHAWTGFDADGALMFTAAGDGHVRVTAEAVMLALGGASWPRLGANGAWADVLARDGVLITPLAPSNCGVVVGWSDHMAKFAGAPLKRIALTLGEVTVRGEAIVTRTGLEGGAVYALSSRVREAVAREGNVSPASVKLSLDLRPDMNVADIARRVSVARGKQSAATFLRKAVSLTPAAIGLLREAGPLPAEPLQLASLVKAVPLAVTGLAGMERAISTAGGVAFEALDGNGMLHARPGVFVAGEMLDWDAPTGGYLLQATFATAVMAADGAARWLSAR